MLCLTIRVDFSDDQTDCHSIVIYIPDPDWLHVNAIADDDSINGLEYIKITNEYYFPNADVLSCKWIRHPEDTSIVITPDNKSDDCDDDHDDDSTSNSILNEIRDMPIHDLINMIDIKWDSHWNCYCKRQRVCGCGCDPLHDGWS